MAKVFIEESTLTNVGNAIRAKKGTTAKIDPANFASEIQAIETAKIQQNKYLEITENGSYNITPDTGYNGIAKVVVDVAMQETPDYSETLIKILDKTITSIVIPDGTKFIGNYALGYCQSLKSVTLNEGLEEIGTSAFCACAITSIVMPSTLKKLGSSVFNSCNSLTSVTLNSGLKEIGSAFSYCSKLTSLTIPSSVTTISGNAFSSMGSSSNKITIIMAGTTPPTIATNTFKTTNLRKIRIPASALSAYSNATN